MKVLILSILLGMGGEADTIVPDTLSLEYCYERVEEHYPLARKSELQQSIVDLQVRLANTGYYPQLEFGGTVSYQSEVTRLPSTPGGIEGPSLSKDQYRVFLDVNQPVYNGGIAGIQKRLEREQGRQEQLSTEVQMQELRSQLDEAYFSILLAREQARTIDLLIENLISQLDMVTTQVKNGVVLASQQHILQAELIKARQDSVETQSTIKAGIRVLEVLIGESIPENTALKLPEVAYPEIVSDQTDVRRPVLKLFESSINVLDHRIEMINAQKMPSVSLFGTLAYGRPGYDFFNNDFHKFYMVGARVQWNFWDWKNSRNEQKVLSLQQERVESDRLAFDRQLNAALSRIEERVESLQEQLRADEEIIELRKKVVAESESQLRNGVITATEFVTELNSETQARLALFARRVQIAQLQVQYATTKGISPSQLSESASTEREK